MEMVFLIQVFFILFIDKPPTYKTSSYIFGALHVEENAYESIECESYDRVILASQTNICLRGDPKKVYEKDIPMQDLDFAKDIYINDVINIVKNNFTHSIDYSFHIYNPSSERICQVKLEADRLKTGKFQMKTDIETIIFSANRFPPSIFFEIILILELLFELYFKVLSIVQSKGLGDQFKSGWQLYDWAIIFILFSLIIYDFVINSIYTSKTIDINSESFDDFKTVIDLMKYELDAISVLSFLYGLRFIKYLRLVPGWGPMILAVLRTIVDIDVLLYICVFFFLMLILSFSYVISYGVEIFTFSEILTTFFHLFCSAFNHGYTTVYNLDRRFIFTFYFIVYVLLSAILVNLFVGIVSDVYPKVRHQSNINWEILMAEYMTDSTLSDQVYKNNRYKIRRRSIIFDLSEEDYWSDIMKGRDGVVYWTVNGLYRLTKETKRKNIVFILYYSQI